MGNREDELKRAIEERYGSIPKFCEVSGIPKSTIYNILDRGVVNTRTKTMEYIYAYIDTSDLSIASTADECEEELVELFRKMGTKQRAAILDTARAMVG